MLYMVTFTINIPQMLAYIPYMDPMGYDNPLSESLEKPSRKKGTHFFGIGTGTDFRRNKGQTQVSLNPLQEIFKENISELLGAIAAKTNNEA